LARGQWVRIMNSDDELLDVEALEVAYGAVQVVWDVSFSIKVNQIVSVIGSNGAGKTTTLKALAGLLMPTRGEIIFQGEEATRMRPHERVNRGIVMCPEGRQLWPRMSVEENLLMGAFPPGLRHKAPANLLKVYEMFPRLKERRRQMAGTLSGGEQQMCAIGRALMAEPVLLMLDEPSLGLAPILVDEIFTFIGKIAESISVLLVEQNINYALGVCDYAYVMETGRIVLEGNGDDLMRNDHVRHAYLGISV
jgi:branched-chain amino acid transport system ATP-binding protein